MLRVELDIFSGMPNPSWVLTEQEEKELLDRIIAQPNLMQSPDSAPDVLGYRGFTVYVEKEDDGAWSKAARSIAGELDLIDENTTKIKDAFVSGVIWPSTFRIGSLESSVASEVISTSSWLLETSEKKDSSVNDFLREVAKGTIDMQAISRAVASTEADAVMSPDGPGMSCRSNYFTGTNYSGWNSIWYIFRNNCYCFASNHRANKRYAAPGNRSLGYFPGLSYDNMRKGLFADGWRDGCVTSRNLPIACVVWKNQDFHFYRKVSSNGVWGHKPGATKTKHTDDSNRTIYNPETCNRGPYKEWYGYYYQDNNTAYVA